MVESLPDYQLERGMRRLVYGGKGHVPTLPEFIKLCRDVGGVGDQDEGPRAVVPQIAPPVDRPWLRDGNLRLLAYITQAKSRGVSPSRYAPDSGMTAECALSWGAETERRTSALVEMKNAWVADVEGGLIANDMQARNSAWADCMKTAESMIDATLLAKVLEAA